MGKNGNIIHSTFPAEHPVLSMGQWEETPHSFSVADSGLVSFSQIKCVANPHYRLQNLCTTVEAIHETTLA